MMKQGGNMDITFIPFKFTPEHSKYVEEMYRLCKDQERKLFDATVEKDDFIGFIEKCLEQPNSLYLAAVDNETDKVCAIMSLENIVYYKDIILEANQHVVFSRHSWGKKAREIASQYFSYLDNNLKPIKRLVACVPQHNYGVIKLLKDVGFKLEGTMRDKLIYPDKENKLKFYNEIMYAKINKEIKADELRW